MSKKSEITGIEKIKSLPDDFDLIKDKFIRKNNQQTDDLDQLLNEIMQEYLIIMDK